MKSLFKHSENISQAIIILLSLLWFVVVWLCRAGVRLCGVDFVVVISQFSVLIFCRNGLIGCRHCPNEIASVSGVQVGTPGVHFDGLVHIGRKTSTLACPIIWFLWASVTCGPRLY